MKFFTLTPSQFFQLKIVGVMLIVSLFLPNVSLAFITTADFPIAADNLAPGNMIGGTIELENQTAGSLELQIEAIGGTPSILTDYLTININTPTAYSASLSDFYTAGPIALGFVSGNTIQSLDLSFTFATSAPASLMGSATNFDFCIGFKGGAVSCGTAFTSSSGRGGSGGSFIRPFVTTEPTPAVLGATTDEVEFCEEYLQGYIRQSANNNPEQVLKLQTFLRDLGGFPTLAITGVYDAPTIAAVRSFQANYRSSILAPWGIAEPTGFVYYTTRKAINEIYCQFTRLFPLTADQLREIERVRQAGQAWVPETAGGVVSTQSTSVGTDSPSGEVAGESTSNGETSQTTQVESDTTASEPAKRPSFFRRIWNWLTSWF